MDTAALATRLHGKFMVLDGPDGAGKSTQRDRLATVLSAAGYDPVLCRDPGGTVIGDRIRSELLHHDLSTMDVHCETLLFMASRAQLVAEIIRPALAAGHTVLCDRFVTSTCAYQGAAGFDPRSVIELARFAIGDCWPDATIVVDVEPGQGFQRIGRKAHHAGRRRGREEGGATLFDGVRPDAMEARSLEFHRRVRELYLEAPTYYPRPVVVVDGHAAADVVHQQILEALARVLA